MYNTSGITSPQHGRGTTKKLIVYHISCKYGASYAGEMTQYHTYQNTQKSVIALSGHVVHNACCYSTFNHSTTTEYSLTRKLALTNALHYIIRVLKFLFYQQK